MIPIRTPTTLDYGRLLFVSAIWGSSFICNDLALQHFAPLAIAGWRVLIATIIILAVCFSMRLPIPTDCRSVLLFAGIGILNGVVPFTLIGWGQQTVDSATAALLIAASPFITLILSHFMTGDDRFSVRRLFGLLIGFVGVLLLFAQEILLEGNTVNGMLAIALAASCYALSGLLIRKLGNVPALVAVAGALLAGTVILLPILIWKYPPWLQSVSPSSGFALLFLAVVPTALAYVLRTRIVQLNGAVFMSNAGYLIPLFAVLWSWLFLSEIPKLVMWLAMLLIFAGIYVGQRKSRRPAISD